MNKLRLRLWRSGRAVGVGALGICVLLAAYVLGLFPVSPRNMWARRGVRRHDHKLCTDLVYNQGCVVSWRERHVVIRRVPLRSVS